MPSFFHSLFLSSASPSLEGPSGASSPDSPGWSDFFSRSGGLTAGAQLTGTDGRSLGNEEPACQLVCCLSFAAVFRRTIFGVGFLIVLYSIPAVCLVIGGHTPKVQQILSQKEDEKHRIGRELGYDWIQDRRIYL